MIPAGFCGFSRTVNLEAVKLMGFNDKVDFDALFSQPERDAILNKFDECDNAATIKERAVFVFFFNKCY